MPVALLVMLVVMLVVMTMGDRPLQTAGADIVMTVTGRSVEMSRVIDASPALLGFETGRGRPPDEYAVEFCDWPFTDPDATIDDHIDVVKQERPTYAVAPDVDGEWCLRDVLAVADELERHAEDVIIVPKDCPPTDIPRRYTIGYPNQPNFGSNGTWWRSTYPPDRPVHVLGGAPNSQLGLADYLTVGSVDGANVAAYAQYGRIWTPGRQLERPDLDYYERVRESLGNIHAVWAMEQSDSNAETGTDTTPEREYDRTGVSNPALEGVQ